MLSEMLRWGGTFCAGSWVLWFVFNWSRSVRCPLPLVPRLFHFGPSPRPLSGKYPVGMRAGFTTEGAVFRLFYPSQQKTRDAPWLVINLWQTLQQIAKFSLLKGLEFAEGPAASGLKTTVVRILAAVLGCLLPANDLRLPVSLDAEELDETRPLVVFSHGLLGSGAENFLMASEWASHGYRVAVVLHLDGSAAMQYDVQGRGVEVQLCPRNNPEKLQFRQSQIKKRSAEVRSTVKHFCRKGDVALAGFSYGSSTVLLAAQELATLEPAIRISCVVALDGWFYNGAQFPPELFGSNKDDTPRRAFPTYFLASASFAKKFAVNIESQKRLVNAGREEHGKTYADWNDTLEIVPLTTHANFSEQLFWNPFPFKIRALGLGECDSVEMYYSLVARGLQFLKQHTSEK